MTVDSTHCFFSPLSFCTSFPSFVFSFSCLSRFLHPLNLDALPSLDPSHILHSQTFPSTILLNEPVPLPLKICCIFDMFWETPIAELFLPFPTKVHMPLQTALLSPHL